MVCNCQANKLFDKEKTDIFRLPFLSLFLLVTLIASNMTEARSPDRQVVLLHCSGDTKSGLDDALCREIVQALAETAGAAGSSAIIRQVSAGAAAPGRPGDLGVTLYVHGNGQSWMAAQLKWQLGQQPATSGPEIRLDVMDRTLGSAELARFARDLITATPGISNALRNPP